MLVRGAVLLVGARNKKDAYPNKFAGKNNTVDIEHKIVKVEGDEIC